MVKDKLSCMLYRIVRKMHHNNETMFKSPWIETMERILSSAGMNNLWINEGDGFSAEYIKKASKL